MDALSPAVEHISATFGDPRVQYCRLEVVDASAGQYAVRGAVLDQTTLDQARAQLSAQLPGVEVDTTGVKVLRSNCPVVTVGTNLTGLYAQPSFLAEQVSQLLNGWLLEVLAEEGNWRFVRQMDGYLGWAFAAYLVEASGCTFTHLVCAPEAAVYTEPDADAPLATRLLGGTPVLVDATIASVSRPALHGATHGWCHVALPGGHPGWVTSEALRGFDVLPATPAARRAQIVADAMRFIGVQYLWGGCSAWGIDCSGFAQLLHRLSGVTLPRDADMQYNIGKPAELPYRPGDLLFFAGANDLREITHVAVSLGGWNIIHSSRRINGVYPENVQEVESLRDSLVGARTFLK